MLDENGNPVLDEDGNPITAITDADGNYFFAVEPGNYQLRFTPPEGFRGTLGDGGDNDADPFSFTTGIINVGAGEHVPDIDAGYLLEVPPSLAFTGADSAMIAIMALVLLTMGIGFVLVETTLARRRREVVIIED